MSPISRKKCSGHVGQLVILCLSLIETETHRVDAITIASRWWAIIKDVPQMTVAFGTESLRSTHAVCQIGHVGDGFLIHGLKEARPSTRALVLCIGMKKWRITCSAFVDTIAGEVTIILSRSRHFGTLSSKDTKFIIIQSIWPIQLNLRFWKFGTMRINVFGIFPIVRHFFIHIVLVSKDGRMEEATTDLKLIRTRINAKMWMIQSFRYTKRTGNETKVSNILRGRRNKWVQWWACNCKIYKEIWRFRTTTRITKF